MKHLLLLAAATLAFAAVGVAQQPESRGARAPDATFIGADGSRVVLSEVLARGPVVLLFMRGFTGEFACFFCGNQTREYVAAYAAIRKAGFDVLMVLPGGKDVAGYLKKVGTADEDHPEPGFTTPYRIVLDPGCKATQAFGVPVDLSPDAPFPVDQPATVVVARDGSIVFAHHGKNPGDRPSVEAVLRALSGARPESAPAASKPAPESKPSVAWLDYEAGVAAARAAHRPLLVDLYALW